jgi:asparagine synthase (glutamine-hydrolysing)
MCGIAGIWERSGKPVDPAALARMSASLVHRGPDGDGIHLDGAIGLANRRLSIIDPTPAGGQPMHLPDRGLWITYNGEIHNYVELRRELESRGARFRTRTDTEVVLQAYAAWGAECFERFNGMWALALWDERERRLVLSRDRFAIKPLCYSVRGSRICFASEPKAIVAAFPEEREPDRVEVAAFLAGARPDRGERTFFDNVRNVTAATCVEFTAEAVRHTRYWRFVPGDETPKPDAEERFRELFADSVRLRMRSDVPVGACLSGGLDSSAIAGLVDVSPEQPMHCFSLRFDGWIHDEHRYAAMAADARPGTFVVHWVRPEARDLVGTMRKIVWHHDAPTPVRGRLGQWFVMKEAGRHVKVVLDGQGGDELLAGYSRFFIPYALDRLRRTAASSPARAGMFRDLADLAWIESRSRLWFLARAPLPYARRARRLRAKGPYRSRVNNELWDELTRDGLPEVLHAEDALSMAFSLESRTPFLDHRLVELCFSLPYTDKISGGWTKSILRRALADAVPAEILARRRKIGFSSPVTSWLRLDDNCRDVRGLLLDRTCLERGIFDRRRLERALSAFASGSQLSALHRTGELWRWITLELWFQEFVDPARGTA